VAVDHRTSSVNDRPNNISVPSWSKSTSSYSELVSLNDHTHQCTLSRLPIASIKSNSSYPLSLSLSLSSLSNHHVAHHRRRIAYRVGWRSLRSRGRCSTPSPRAPTPPSRTRRSRSSTAAAVVGIWRANERCVVGRDGVTYICFAHCDNDKDQNDKDNLRQSLTCAAWRCRGPRGSR
jgi:hypothetical protein